MSTKLEKRIDVLNGTRKEKEFSIQLQPINLKLRTPKVYQVISDQETTQLIEHDVVRIGGGKTKYDATTKTLEQSKRYHLSTPPFKIDIFDDSNHVEHYTYSEGGKNYTVTSYFFTDKNKAVQRRQYEGFKLLMKDIKQVA